MSPHLCERRIVRARPNARSEDLIAVIARSRKAAKCIADAIASGQVPHIFPSLRAAHLTYARYPQTTRRHVRVFAFSY
jgi:hypothetical protein